MCFLKNEELSYLKCCSAELNWKTSILNRLAHHNSLMSVGKEFANVTTTSPVRNTEKEGEEQNGLLKRFKDIMLKQRPESVSHLLQDNLPKCKITWKNPHRPDPLWFFFPVCWSLSHFSCINLPVWSVLWEKDRWKEERSYLSGIQNSEPKGTDLSHGRWLLRFSDHQEGGVRLVQQWLPGHESSSPCVWSSDVSSAILRVIYKPRVLCRSFCRKISEELTCALSYITCI